MSFSYKIFLIAPAILLLTGACLPSTAVAGMIWGSLEIGEKDNVWAEAQEMSAAQNANTENWPPPAPENANLSNAPSDAGCGSTDASSDAGASSPALVSEVQYPPLETSLSLPLVYFNPQVPAFHLDRIFRPPRI